MATVTITIEETEAEGLRVHHESDSEWDGNPDTAGLIDKMGLLVLKSARDQLSLFVAGVLPGAQN